MTYFAYSRASTQRQSDQGVSLIEQRRSINEYAACRGLSITDWLEETETAEKSGRPMFRQVLDQLTRADDVGLLVHKIDRSARNLRDWADLGDLIDRGVDVRFTHDDFNLSTRGARLSADIQAVTLTGERQKGPVRTIPVEFPRTSPAARVRARHASPASGAGWTVASSRC